jgi:hypothetical protein
MYNKAMNEPMNRYYAQKLLKKTRNNKHERKDFRDLVTYLQLNLDLYPDYKGEISNLINLAMKN